MILYFQYCGLILIRPIFLVSHKTKKEMGKGWEDGNCDSQAFLQKSRPTIKVVQRERFSQNNDFQFSLFGTHFCYGADAVWRFFKNSPFVFYRQIGLEWHEGNKTMTLKSLFYVTYSFNFEPTDFSRLSEGLMHGHILTSWHHFRNWWAKHCGRITFDFPSDVKRGDVPKRASQMEQMRATPGLLAFQLALTIDAICMV